MASRMDYINDQRRRQTYEAAGFNPARAPQTFKGPMPMMPQPQQYQQQQFQQQPSQQMQQQSQPGIGAPPPQPLNQPMGARQSKFGLSPDMRAQIQNENLMRRQKAAASSDVMAENFREARLNPAASVDTQRATSAGMTLQDYLRAEQMKQAGVLQQQNLAETAGMTDRGNYETGIGNRAAGEGQGAYLTQLGNVQPQLAANDSTRALTEMNRGFSMNMLDRSTAGLNDANAGAITAGTGMLGQQMQPGAMLPPGFNAMPLPPTIERREALTPQEMARFVGMGASMARSVGGGDDTNDMIRNVVNTLNNAQGQPAPAPAQQAGGGGGSSKSDAVQLSQMPSDKSELKPNTWYSFNGKVAMWTGSGFRD